MDNRIATSLPGMNQVAIDELAARTVAAATSDEGERRG